MYKIIIETQYNVINLVTNDIEEYREVFDQPYVKNVEIKELKTLEELITERDEILNRTVGVSYWYQRVLELNKEIEEVQYVRRKTDKNQRQIFRNDY